jgi:hypothetical protein
LSFSIDAPRPRVAAQGANVLPLARSDLNDTKQTLVHFKVASFNNVHRLEVAQAINEALGPVRVNGNSIVAMLTDEDVNMTAIDIQILAAYVIPSVKSALGIP